METRSRKRLRLDYSMADNTQEDEVENLTNSNPRLNRKTEHQNHNTGNEMDVAAIIKLYDNGEYNQEMLNQNLSIQERFIYFHLSKTKLKLDRAISFLFKSELTKVVDIRKVDYKNYYSDLMKYYKMAPIIFPQILAQLYPNIIEFRKMDLSNLSHVAFLDEYKKNIPKHSETGIDKIQKNKFAGYIDLFVHTMPHLIEMMISEMGVDGVKVMMEAFGCQQETVDSMFNLVKEFKIKIDDTKLSDKQLNQKIEETIALLLKCPNTKTLDISLVEYRTYSSPIVNFFNSIPSSFTQAFAQLCPRIEQIFNNGNLIFNTELFASYARGTNGRCNMAHVNLLGYRQYSKMEVQQLQHYIDNCSRLKRLEISLDICNFLIIGQSIEANKNLIGKLKCVEEMKLSDDHRSHNIDFVKQFMLIFTELKKLKLKLGYFTLRHTYFVKEIFTAINLLPSLTCVELDVHYITCLEFIRPSLIKKLCIRDMSDTRPEQMNSIKNLSNLKSLTLYGANNNIIPFVSQLNLTMVFNLKHIKIHHFNGDPKQLFSAATALSQNIRFDFECVRYDMT